MTKHFTLSNFGNLEAYGQQGLIHALRAVEERGESWVEDSKTICGAFHQSNIAHELAAYYLIFYLRAHASKARPLYDKPAGYVAGLHESGYDVPAFVTPPEEEKRAGYISLRYEAPLLLANCTQQDKALIETLRLDCMRAPGETGVDHCDGFDTEFSGFRSKPVPMCMVDFSDPIKVNAAVEHILRDDAFWKCIGQLEGVMVREHGKTKHALRPILHALPNPFQEDSWYYRDFDKAGTLLPGSLQGEASDSPHAARYQQCQDAKAAAASIDRLERQLSNAQNKVKDRGHLFQALVREARSRLPQRNIDSAER